MFYKQKYVVIGLGAFGKEIARTLKEHHADVVVIDKHLPTVNQMREEGFEYAVQIDTTDCASLAKFIKPEDIVVIAMGESFEDNILTVGSLTTLGVKKIFTRATKEIHVKILERMQVVETLFPEKQEGKRFALKLLNKDVIYIDEYAPDVYISEIDVPIGYFGMTIMELKVRSRFGLNIIGLKERSVGKDGKEAQKMYPINFENIKLDKRHTLVIVGNDKNIHKFLEGINEPV